MCHNLKAVCQGCEVGYVNVFPQLPGLCVLGEMELNEALEALAKKMTSVNFVTGKKSATSTAYDFKGV